jgi:hypothetical protein
MLLPKGTCTHPPFTIQFSIPYAVSPELLCPSLLPVSFREIFALENCEAIWEEMYQEVSRLHCFHARYMAWFEQVLHRTRRDA